MFWNSHLSKPNVDVAIEHSAPHRPWTSLLEESWQRCLYMLQIILRWMRDLYGFITWPFIIWHHQMVEPVWWTDVERSPRFQLSSDVENMLSCSSWLPCNVATSKDNVPMTYWASQWEHSRSHLSIGQLTVVSWMHWQPCIQIKWFPWVFGTCQHANWKGISYSEIDQLQYSKGITMYWHHFKSIFCNCEHLGSVRYEV